MAQAIRNQKKIVLHPHIERRAGVCGGEPVIKATRLTVSLIAELEQAGKTVDEIVALYPHVTHAQVYDALAYYYDNKAEIDRYRQENTPDHLHQRYKGAPWMK
ncbi:MAG: DUF433 domain-containing protein [Candidatus Bipolaricaulota bacterium]|nr:DUF433 domain-containing protein [Candidatus Bipolaricaulota bacterium]MDW8140906.1 DUF433 domain-containing protein [Candidatus Bipolaricaulota bacterium]